MGTDKVPIPSRHSSWGKRRHSPEDTDPRPSGRHRGRDRSPEESDPAKRGRFSGVQHGRLRSEEEGFARLPSRDERPRGARWEGHEVRRRHGESKSRPQHQQDHSLGARHPGRDEAARGDTRAHNTTAARGRWGEEPPGELGTGSSHPSKLDKRRERSREREGNIVKDSRQLAREDFERHRQKKEDAERTATAKANPPTQAGAGASGKASEPDGGRHVRQALTQHLTASRSLPPTMHRPRQERQDPFGGGGKWGHDKFEEVKDGPVKRDTLDMLSWW